MFEFQDKFDKIMRGENPYQAQGKLISFNSNLLG